ncbi:MAG: succinylglutamate desuccinylase/aspartoacylase family protein [Colwellia sp.]|nr:succinylglutamate desuccinylase/aspartoacylase family protein [Colwellia sp.]
MEIDFSEINYLQDPSWQDLHADYVQFLLSMSGPTVIDITGKNTSKCRVINTLLQGNEPSGLIALHRWLTTRDEQKLPVTNLRFIICSVEAASKNPLFSRRFIENTRDLNRCFGKQAKANANEDEQQGSYERALLIEQVIREVKPEMVIDLHNASSPGPTFSVSSIITTETLSIASFFCQTLILSDLQIGALMEQNFACPFITIECGGNSDEQAHEVAFAGISHIAACKQIGYIHQEKNVEVIYRPLRLQTKSNIKLSFAEHDEGYRGVTLKNNIEYFNFGGAQQDEMIGWTDGDGIENLQLVDNKGNNVINEYFYTRENQLVCKQNLRLFKATNNKQAALNDCLFYVVKHSISEA